MSESLNFESTNINQVRQVAKRGHYDRDTVYRILDDNLVAHVGWVTDQGPVIIPMLFARRDDELLFHGSTKSRLMQMLCRGVPVCVSATSLDGLVLAKSLFHHSMNYRSVTVFGEGREIVDEADRMESLRIITDKVMQGRWEDARQPSRQEMKATCIASITIQSASAKIREGDPVEDQADTALSIWSGVIPLKQIATRPIRAAEDKNETECPQYIRDWFHDTKSAVCASDLNASGTTEGQGKSILGDLEGYQPRATSMIGIHEIRGWKFKFYTISIDGQSVENEVVKAALEHLQWNVRWPDRTQGFGFVTLHYGEHIWLLVDLWVDDILRHFVFRADHATPTKFCAGPDDGTAVCVWELEVTRHERDAWVKHILSSPAQPAFEKYLADSLEIPVA